MNLQHHQRRSSTSQFPGNYTSYFPAARRCRMVFTSSISPNCDGDEKRKHVCQAGFKMGFQSALVLHDESETKRRKAIGRGQKRHIIIIFRADYTKLLAPSLCVCVCRWAAAGKTPLQSLFNFPHIKLHARAISRAADYRKVILEIINRPRSCVPALGNLCLRQ